MAVGGSGNKITIFQQNSIGIYQKIQQITIPNVTYISKIVFTPDEAFLYLGEDYGYYQLIYNQSTNNYGDPKFVNMTTSDQNFYVSSMTVTDSFVSTSYGADGTYIFF